MLYKNDAKTDVKRDSWRVDRWFIVSIANGLAMGAIMVQYLCKTIILLDIGLSHESVLDGNNITKDFKS